MKPLKNFKEFLKLGVVKQQDPDMSRAEFLIKETEVSFEGLNERLMQIGVNDKNANSIIKDCYDILMGLIRAKMHIDGFKAQGAGAHESEVSYMRVLKLNERDIDFANNLRYFRNGAIYYGTILDRVYAEKVVDFTKRMYPKLKNLFKK